MVSRPRNGSAVQTFQKESSPHLRRASQSALESLTGPRKLPACARVLAALIRYVGSWTFVREWQKL